MREWFSRALSGSQQCIPEIIGSPNLPLAQWLPRALTIRFQEAAANFG
ncbi:hypothetical protein ACPOL_4835 [Acidisarcina polymorpha]|uniref:Uncharacterized protein n=1 Tax=Acidisarcina polymorpha TaxID=2211140 RepID=A0A2Z5G5N6_9BACT|nr:hypothetical protein ACPOL_4835 [Acidisarcina polymorpha]